MKLFTFDSSDFDIPEENYLKNGISVKPYASTIKTNSHKRTSSTNDNNDFCIRIGNGNEATGIVLLSRENPPETINNYVYDADIYFKNGLGKFLIKPDFDPDNRIFILFKNIELIENAQFSCKDDYMKIILPGEEIKIENLYGGEFFVENKLEKNNQFLKIKMNDNKFIIY